MVVALGGFALAALIALSAHAQVAPVRASEADQKSLELAVATLVTGSGGLALDPRLYVRSPLVGARPPMELLPAIVPSSERSAARDSAHLAAVAGALHTTAIDNDATHCVTERPEHCRGEGYAGGFVSIGAAWTVGDKTQISIVIHYPPTTRNGNPISFVSAYYFEGERDGAGWKVRIVDHFVT